MRARSCADLAELRSAYVDGALGDADRERLLAHLVDCADCRRDVAELRHVRSLLTGSTDPGLAPVDLSDRLVSIAGDDAAAPLWTRPFRRTGRGGLPSQRHLARTRVVALVLGCGLAALAVLGVGYAAGPADGAQTEVVPTSQAVAEFTSVVSGFPLDARVSAALQGRRPTTGGPLRPTAISVLGDELTEPEAAALLVRAGQAGDELTYTATQIVIVDRDGQRLSNSVRVSGRGGEGIELSPRTSGQQAVSAGTYVGSDTSTRMADADLIDRLAGRYTLRGWTDQWYGGRSTAVVEAVEPLARPSAGALDGVVARWWLDTESGLLLGQETYDQLGGLVVSSRLTGLRLNEVDDSVGTAPGLAARTTATLTLSRVQGLGRDGWICADQLAGLRLLRLRTDQTTRPELVHLVYSDGLTTVSVIEQRGRLAGAPPGSTRNETLGAWVTDGMPTTATWTSGDVVLTVVTDGSRETLAAAVAALPHRALERPTTMDRVRAGWARILGR